MNTKSQNWLLALIAINIISTRKQVTARELFAESSKFKAIK
jgi:hypothetical protein